MGAEWGYSALRQKAKVQRRYSEGTAKGFRSYCFEIKGLKNYSRFAKLKDLRIKELKRRSSTKSIKVSLVGGEMLTASEGNVKCLELDEKS